MIKLYDFIGGMLADISEARQIADHNSVLLSQSYHTDEFMKGMPVPHYTIDEAEITVPVMVVGVQPDSGQYTALEKGVVGVIRLKLPELLYVMLKNSYLKCQKDRKQQLQQEQRAREFQNSGSNLSGAAPPAANEGEKIPAYLKNRYRQSVEAITSQFEGPMEHFLHSANFEVVKLLDVKDYFCELLQNFMLQEFADYDEAGLPWQGNDQMVGICQDTGTRMFFEFKQIAQNSRGVLVEPSTSKMNEYGSRDCITYIRLKVREQDVDCVVEGNEKGGRRFLSLT